MRAAPAVSCAMLHKNMLHMSIQVQRRASGLPCAMALRLIRNRPGDRLSCHHRRHRLSLPPTWRQHRGVGPKRFRRTLQPVRLACCRVHRSLPLVCDDGLRPSGGTGWREL